MLNVVMKRVINVCETQKDNKMKCAPLFSGGKICFNTEIYLWTWALLGTTPSGFLTITAYSHELYFGSCRIPSPRQPKMSKT